MLSHINHRNSVRLLAEDLAENSATSGIAKTPGSRKYLNRIKAESKRESKLAQAAALKLESRIEQSCCFVGICSRFSGKKQNKTVDDKVKEESKDTVETVVRNLRFCTATAVDTKETLPTSLQEEETSMDEPEASQTIISTRDFILDPKKTQVDEKSGGWLDELSFTFLSSTQALHGVGMWFWGTCRTEDNCCGGRAKLS